MTATDSYLLLRAFCDELARCGLRHACTSPGSRCTPIVLSLVREPGIVTWSHLDERCAGFFAVGAAQASGRPVAIACTSGTAAANYAPAVIEADQARVPLLVLTADRPPELREVGAGQAIDQLKLYGAAVRWFFEVGVDLATPASLSWMRQLACRTYATALGPVPGPVHLNFPLREPLVLDAPLPPDPVPGRDGGRPWVTVTAPAVTVPADRELPARGVVVAGRGREPGLGAAAAHFAQRAGYPLLADPLSGARHGPAAIAAYDLLLRGAGFAARMAPDLVIRVGDLPTSKPLREWLQGLTEARQIGLGAETAWQDPAAVVAELSNAAPDATLTAWTPSEPLDPAWLASWRAADETVASAVEAELHQGGLSEPLVARRLGQWLGADATLFAASSMPIRDIEEFFPAGIPVPRVLANRGANGIDGTISAAFGVAAVTDGPVVVLIGDVALAHDIGGLMAARRLALDLTIVLLNNDGGGIFSFLPVATQRDAFEDHVATPHGLDFAHAATLFGCDHIHAGSEAAFQAGLEAGLGAGGTTIIEVRTDRARNLELHQRIAAHAGSSMRRAARFRPGGHGTG